MLRIGLTGGIGSGKTTVADLFGRHGVPVIDSDDIARALAQPGQPPYDEIVRAFGADILDDKGRIDRPKLRKLVFTDTARRKQLEAILHPHIRGDIERQLRGLRGPYCVIVVPLLIEAGFTDLVDRILVVDCDEQQQVARVAARSGLADADVRRIMQAQLSRTDRLKHADDTLVNSGDVAALEAATEVLHRHYLRLAAAPA
jgi:dephospho-CoA kinase